MALPSPLDAQEQISTALGEPITINLEARICLRELEKICADLRNLAPDEALTAGFDRHVACLNFEDSRAKFKAWGVNIAAFRSESRQTSLQFRLRNAPDIQKRVSQVLAELQEYLDGSSQIISGKRKNETWTDDVTSDSDSDAEQEKPHKVGKGIKSSGAESTSELQELFIAINSSIVSLMKLSKLIRECSKRDDYAKAASRYDTWDPSPDINHVREKTKLAKTSSTWLLERLGKAITRRRQFLTYRIDHHGKLTGDWGEDLDGVDETIEESKKPAKTILTSKATTFVPNMVPHETDGLDVAGSFGSQTSYEATEVGSEDGPTKLKVPPPPKWAFEDVLFKYGEPFQCPLCFTEQVVKNKNAWKKHVFRDLKPYVCTFRGCAMRMFGSRNKWFSHELQCHRREWTCQFCQHGAFRNAETFSKHVLSMHPDILASSKMEAVVKQSEEPVVTIPPDACPLCTEWERDLRDPKQYSKRLLLNNGKIVEPYGTPKQFRRHLGRHMEQFALFALPVKQSDELEDESPDDQEHDSTDPGSQKNSVNAKPDGSKKLDSTNSPDDPTASPPDIDPAVSPSDVDSDGVHSTRATNASGSKKDIEYQNSVDDLSPKSSRAAKEEREKELTSKEYTAAIMEVHDAAVKKVVKAEIEMEEAVKKYQAQLQDQLVPPERPIITRMARKHLSIESLRVFSIDYTIDEDPDYVLIKRWVPEHEQNMLWKHTFEIREQRQPVPSTKSSEKMAESSPVRRPSRADRPGSERWPQSYVPFQKSRPSSPTAAPTWQEFEDKYIDRPGTSPRPFYPIETGDLKGPLSGWYDTADGPWVPRPLHDDVIPLPERESILHGQPRKRSTAVYHTDTPTPQPSASRGRASYDVGSHRVEVASSSRRRRGPNYSGQTYSGKRNDGKPYHQGDSHSPLLRFFRRDSMHTTEHIVSPEDEDQNITIKVTGQARIVTREGEIEISRNTNTSGAT